MIIGVDVGGTFTDLVLVDRDRGLMVTKVVTTPEDHSVGIVRGIKEVLLQAGAAPTEIERFILGSTVATNAVIERKGAKTAVLATKGFEDTLEIGRQKRSELYDLFIDPETPSFLSPRRMRVGIRERLDATGQVLVPLDKDQVREAVAKLVAQFKIEAVAVCYLFSFLNGEHEQRTKEIIQKHFPYLGVSLSSEIDPVFREYERMCVTTLDAYLRPAISRHLEHLATSLAEAGVHAELEVMQSRGGICTFRHITQLPVKMILSGPAAGVLGAQYVAEQAGYRDIISLDMGGTSADIAVVKDGKVATTTEGKILTYPFRVPMVDVSSIGAGGGSIAWLDAAGGLHVGPESAGAVPGPACYGWGGTAPTVTDASVVLGYVNPKYFAGGTLELDAEAAHRVVQRIADPLGLSVSEAAWAIHAIVNAKMADEIHLWTVCRGYDPRGFTLVLLGGAGPVSGGMVAKPLSISTVLIPSTPGVLSAFGLLVANIEHDHSAPFKMAGEKVSVESMAAVFRELDKKGLQIIARDRVPPDKVNVLRSADLRYTGQSYELNVVLEGELGQNTVTQCVRDFHGTHQRVYGQHSPENPVEFVNLRAVYSYPLQKPKLHPPSRGTDWARAKKGSRLAYFFPKHPAGIEVPVYDRNHLPVDREHFGPLIIEQADTTTVVYPDWCCRVDRLGNIIVTDSLGER